MHQHVSPTIVDSRGAHTEEPTSRYRRTTGMNFKAPLIVFMASCALLVACASTPPPDPVTAPTSDDEPTADVAVEEEFNLSKPPLSGGFGGDGLEEIDEVQFAVFVVTGAVIETHGPEVTLADDDFVIYDRVSGGAFPSVTVQLDGPSTELEREEPYSALMGTVREAIENSGTVELQHPDGKLEVGHRYAFFVGPWEADLANIFYAFDVSEDRPAPGFRSGYGTAKARISGIAETQNLSFETDLEMVIEFAQDLKPNVSPRTGLAAFPLVEPTEEVDQFEDRYPIDETDGSPSDREGLVRIRVVISNAEPGDRYGLQGETRYLGWFGVNSNGRALITGFVDPAASYEVVRFISDQLDDFEPVAGGRFEIGETGARLQIETLDDGELSVTENESVAAN